MEPDRERAPSWHRSVFARLVALMVAMGAILLAMVGGFYFFLVIPGLHASLDRFVGQHVRAIAESRPDSASARALASRLDLQVRFEGPGGGWTTDPDVPTFEALGRLRHGRSFFHIAIPRHAYYVVVAGEDRYIFSRTFAARFGRAHDQMLLVLLVLMAAIFATAYTVMRRALRPLRLLGDGVAQLGEGRLDVAVPKQSDDEFGVLTDAFNRMVGRVRERVRARDQLLLDASHELRSPLTRMKVALALLPESPQKRSMGADVDEMETLVNQLLELERLREGHHLQRAPHDVVTLLREAVERAGDRPPGVRLLTPLPSAVLDVDAARVRTVFRNLIENALKYSLPDSRAVQVSAVERPQELEIRVADDGPGIPQGAEEGLFEPFVRLDPSRSKKTGGYGLGLSICKRIMEAHGGSIAVEPTPGRGATFVLRFPRRPTPRSAGEAAAP